MIVGNLPADKDGRTMLVATNAYLVLEESCKGKSCTK